MSADRERAKATEQLIGTIVFMALAVPADDVRHFLEQVGQQDTLMPLLDPTSYLRGGRDLSGVARDLGEAFLRFRTVAEKARAKAVAAPALRKLFGQIQEEA